MIVPYVKKGFENSCTECCAEMVLKYYEINNIDQYEIKKLGYYNFDKLEGFFEQFNFIVYYKRDGNINNVKYCIDEKIPVIVRIISDSKNLLLHTFLIIGYDKKEFYYHDNELGSNKSITFSAFNKIWTGNYIIVSNKVLKMLK